MIRFHKVSNKLISVYYLDIFSVRIAYSPNRSGKWFAYDTINKLGIFGGMIVLFKHTLGISYFNVPKN